MTNLNKPYTKHRRNDGRTLEYTVYNRSTNAVIKTGRSKLLTKEGVIDVIRDDPNNYIENRDLIYKVVKKYCEDHPEVKHFDPTYLLRENRDYMQDNEHFVIAKLGYIFEHLYVNYIAS